MKEFAQKGTFLEKVGMSQNRLAPGFVDFFDHLCRLIFDSRGITEPPFP
jgi:hypothetical protein